MMVLDSALFFLIIIHIYMGFIWTTCHFRDSVDRQERGLKEGKSHENILNVDES